MADLKLVVKVATEGADKLNDLSGKLGTVGRNLTVGVSLPLIAAGGAFIAMAAEAEKADAKLGAVFDSMNAASFTTIEQLNDQADALAKATTFDDDTIKEAQATLLTFGNVTGESFDRATAAALDMASFFEGDLQQASIQLGKALNDPIAGLGALSRIGIQFTDEQKALIESLVETGDVAAAQGIILAEVERQVGTVAEELAATSGGQLAQAMNQLGEAGESIGVLLLPVLTTLAGVLGNLATWFQDLDPGIKGFIVAIAGIAIVVGPVLLILGGLISAFGAVGGAFTALSTLLLANPFVALIAAIIALVALVILNWDKIVESFQNLWKNITDTMQRIADAVSAAWDFIVGVFTDAVKSFAGIGDKIFKPIGKGFEAAIGVIKGIWNAFVRFWNGIQINVPSINIPFIGRVGGFSIGLPDLPFLAEGGIVNDPTLAVLGEKGPEAVIPLDRMNQGTTINLNVQGDLKAEERTLPGLLLRTLYVAGVD